MSCLLRMSLEDAEVGLFSSMHKTTPSSTPSVSGASDDKQRSTGSFHTQTEGKPSHYSGDNNEDDSGMLKYVVIKHPCAEAAPGDELNGLTLNAVGSGTTNENIQVYSTSDDGFEQPFHGLDIVYSWYPTNNVTFEGRIKNILNS